MGTYNQCTRTLCPCLLPTQVDGVLQPEVYRNVQFGKSAGNAACSWYVTGIPHPACLGRWHLGWRRQLLSDEHSEWCTLAHVCVHVRVCVRPSGTWAGASSSSQMSQ